MAKEDVCKLEEWQALTIQSLDGERARVAKEAQGRINGITAAIQRYAKEWGDGEGPCDFEARPDDGLYLVRKQDERGVAPAT